MNAFKSLLVATAVVVGMGNVPLFAQAKEPATKGVKHYQVEAQITNIDQSTGQLTIESKKIPGHEGATLALPYKVAHPAALQMYKTGDKVSADLVATAKGPVVQSIASLAEPPQVGMVTDTSMRNRGPADTTCIDVCAGISDQTAVSAQPGMQRDSVSTRVDIQGNPEAAAQISGIQRDDRKGQYDTVTAQVKVEENAVAPAPPGQTYRFTGRVTSVNASGRQITIAADSVPGTATGALSFSYAVPDSIAITAFHEGDWVNGDVVVSENLTTVKTLQLGKGTSELKSESKSDMPKTPDAAPKDPDKKY